jgi:hypothetical protein
MDRPHGALIASEQALGAWPAVLHGFDAPQNVFPIARFSQKLAGSQRGRPSDVGRCIVAGENDNLGRRIAFNDFLQDGQTVDLAQAYFQ